MKMAICKHHKTRTACEQLAVCFHSHVLAHQLNLRKLSAAQFKDVCISVPAITAVPVPVVPLPAVVIKPTVTRSQLTCAVDNDATRRACAAVQTIASMDGVAEAASLHSHACTAIDCIVCHLHADVCGRSQRKISSTVAHLRCDVLVLCGAVFL